MKRKLFILGSLACLGLASSTQAAIMYNYVALPPSGGIVNGATNVVSLYFQETLTNGSTSVVNDPANAPGGLYAGGVAMVMQVGGVGVTVKSAVVNTTVGSVGSPASSTFEGGSFAEGNNSAGVVTAAAAPGAYLAGITTSSNDGSSADDPGGPLTHLISPTNTITSPNTIVNQYLIGTVSLTVGAAPNATFKVESLHDAVPAGVAPNGYLHSGVDGNTIDNAGHDFDKGGIKGGGDGTSVGADGNPTTFAITSPIPEPGSLMMCGLVASGLAFRRRRAQKA